MQYVYVLNLDGRKLMPCKPSKARRLLKSGKAKVIKRAPFTIKLTWACENNVQEVIVGVDKGSKLTGYSVISYKSLLMSGYIRHRLDVATKLSSRSANRRSRRGRLWHRAPRFLNRKTNSESRKTPPSVKANVDEVLRVLERIPIPISSVVIEDVKIDMETLPTGEGVASGIRGKCIICHSIGRTERHHIRPTASWGKDSKLNTIWICRTCHNGVHTKKVTLDRKGESGFLDRIAQRTMQGKSYLYKKLRKKYELRLTEGIETKKLRIIKGLEKTHDSDAFIIASVKYGALASFNRDNFYFISFRATQTRRKYYELPKKGKGRVRYQVNNSLGGFYKGDIVLINNKVIKQINSIYSRGYLAFKRIKDTPNTAIPEKCKLLESRGSILFSKELMITLLMDKL